MLLTFQRGVCFLIDVIIVYVPTLLLAQSLFRDMGGASILIAQFLFIIYNIICITTFGGRTLGKYFGKIVVVYEHTENILVYGTREFSKLLYTTPYVNVIFISVSLLLKIAKGKFLHDLIGQSDVFPIR